MGAGNAKTNNKAKKNAHFHGVMKKGVKCVRLYVIVFTQWAAI